MVERPVHGRRRAAAAVMAAAMMLLLGAGTSACVEVNGGAAELSWFLSSFSGQRISDCRCAGIEQVRLCWIPEDEVPEDATELPCPPTRSRQFPCSESRGATDFVIDSKPHLFWIEPLAGDASPLAKETYEVPPPILRSVRYGGVVTLNSLLIVAQPDCSDPDCGKKGFCTNQAQEVPREEP